MASVVSSPRRDRHSSRSPRLWKAPSGRLHRESNLELGEHAATSSGGVAAAKADARWRHALDALARMRAPTPGDSTWPAAHALLAAVRRATPPNATAQTRAGFGCARCRAVPSEPVTWECGHTSCRACVDARGCARGCGMRSSSSAPLEVNVLVRSLADKWFPRAAHGARLRKQAAQLFAQARFEEAQTQLDAALQLDPCDHVALAARSRIHLRGGRIQEALRDAEAAVSARPDWGEAHYRHGCALSAARRDEEALRSLLVSAATEPDRDLSTDVATLLARVDLATLLSRRGLAGLRSTLEAAHGPAETTIQIHGPAETTIQVGVAAEDLECVLCARLLLRPVTTPCGHTYCANCLDRCLDYGCACPLCKTSLTKYLLLGGGRATTDWLECALSLVPPPLPLAPPPSEHVPLFVCTTAFPSVACPLFVYEPRYRALVRAVVARGNGAVFGMVPALPGNRGPGEFGTLQVIADWLLLPDGCSIVTTTGTRRFRVVSRGETDGYHTAQVALLSDQPPRPSQATGLVELAARVRGAAQRWLRSAVSAPLLSEIARSFGPFPAEEADWLGSTDGPAWAWWLLAVLPLGPQLQSSILATTDLAKRLKAIQKTLEHIQRPRKPPPAVANDTVASDDVANDNQPQEQTSVADDNEAMVQ